MANARVLGRREQLIAHSSALTAASQSGRILLDRRHVASPPYSSIHAGFFRADHPVQSTNL
jgi:hypothetical protein